MTVSEWPTLSEAEQNARHPRSNASIKELRDQLAYQPTTGALCRLSPRKKLIKAPAIQPDLSKGGYLFTCVDGFRYRTHVLIFSLYFGSWPEGVIDHFDGNKLNNVISNLRDVPPAVNSQNQFRAQRDSVSGLLGVCPDKKQKGKWKAYITVGGKFYNLGRHSSAAKGHEAYLKAKASLHGESWLASAVKPSAGVSL